MRKKLVCKHTPTSGKLLVPISPPPREHRVNPRVDPKQGQVRVRVGSKGAPASSGYADSCGMPSLKPPSSHLMEKEGSPKQLASISEAAHQPPPRRRAPPRGRVGAESPRLAAGGRRPRTSESLPQNPLPSEPQAELGRALAPLTARPAVSACSGLPGHPRALCCRPSGGAGQAQGAARAAVPTRTLARAGAGPPRAAAAARAPPSCRGRMWAGSGREAGASWWGGSPGCTGACPAPGWWPARTWTQQAATRDRRRGFAPSTGPTAFGARHRGAPLASLRAEDAGTRVADLLAR